MTAVSQTFRADYFAVMYEQASARRSFVDSLRVDSLRVDSLRVDSLRADSVRVDFLRLRPAGAKSGRASGSARAGCAN
jgi:hypothetical protein